MAGRFGDNGHSLFVALGPGSIMSANSSLSAAARPARSAKACWLNPLFKALRLPLGTADSTSWPASELAYYRIGSVTVRHLDLAAAAMLAADEQRTPAPRACARSTKARQALRASVLGLSA